MAFFFRMRYKFPYPVKNRAEAQKWVDDARNRGKLESFYDGQTIELIDEPQGLWGSLKKQLLGK